MPPWLTAAAPRVACSSPAWRRSFFKLSRQSSKETPTTPAAPILEQDNLFYPLSKSPFPQLVERGKRIRIFAQCPVCLKEHGTRRSVQHECSSCGYPTHCSEDHWKADSEHNKYCSRLRESNEDEHDLRSGRELTEFEMPGEVPYEQAVSLANWDVFWYTAGFGSIDTERQRRHASKLMTYPMSVAATLHQHSPLTQRNHRLTPEGARSLAAIRTTLHVPLGTPDIDAMGINRPPMRLFILGARSESALPPHIWEQACLLFPSATFQIYFIGKEISVPRARETSKPSPATSNQVETPAASSSTVPAAWRPQLQVGFRTDKKVIPMDSRYGVQSFYIPHSPRLSITGLRANFGDIFPHFAGTFDPYTDAFFLFHPGLGFPSLDSPDMLQINSPTEWGPALPQLLSTKCPIFVTAFSPTDMERDVRSLETAEGVGGEFDWILTPGPNPFSSDKWDVAEFDPRVMVKTNWGIWSIRGKRRDIREL